ncbi:predicted protein [Sclerotinia sclerotiorum 1980 UF-70]|uniref:Uncharacterized protein n=1 Tax=Sclerotinia sclerotiorum (strain ATCC 18683 / 1980 / Ss-1) TaxID=665079 RepID=A7EGQ6_SCLS1|nr:predicted protein [Sclerotinia sclerotiorum 1980 UF-70]EDO02022.1 predicted protein [Sclerotinia sclerotiorum 1980 UF-70]
MNPVAKKNETFDQRMDVKLIFKIETPVLEISEQGSKEVFTVFSRAQAKFCYRNETFSRTVEILLKAACSE